VIPTPVSTGYLPFRDGRSPLRVGARPLPPDGWLEVDDGRDGDLARKRALLGTSAADLLAWLPGTEAAAQEVLDAIVAELREHHGIATAPDASLHPIDAAGRLVQEDLCLHLERDGELVLAAASVCFPAKWSVRDKIGRSLVGVHAPVPGYADTLGPSVDRLLAGNKLGAEGAGLRGKRAIERSASDPAPGICRLNWSINASGALCQLDPGAPVDPVVVEPSSLWLRVERQTLRRFDRHGGVLFTIRTYQQTLASLAGHPDVCADLAAAVRALSPALRAYKGLTELAEPVARWLDGVVPE
jgi:dimethylamine monooxygenase subunit A